MANLMRTPPANESKNTPYANKRSRIDYPSAVDPIDTLNDGSVDQITLNGMMQMMMAQFTETKNLIDIVRSEVSEINGKIDAVKSELQNEIKSLKDECAAKFQHNDAALDSLKEKINSVGSNISTLENRNELIITGIPYQTNENLSTLLRGICNHLALNETITQLAETRRMKTGDRTDGNSLIVVEFALKTTRDEFYRAYLRKRDLTLRHLGLDSDRRVYINESLSLETRKVKVAALRLKKDGRLTSVYTRQGVVFVKRSVNGPPVAIRSEEELEHL